ncbi:Methyltransferase type 11 [Apiospora phragmitis]|uniref:Methyltransferase type 11 n=1 Tax=Apiospora phragmitis TaxID=2905665 RepID=A0ABR1VY03_9PEZI
MAQNAHSYVTNDHGYYFEHGRVYGTFKRGQCLSPVDDVSITRSAGYIPQVLHLVFRGLTSRPLLIDSGTKILDLGCGTVSIGPRRDEVLEILTLEKAVPRCYYPWMGSKSDTASIPGTGVFEHIEIDFQPYSTDHSLPDDAKVRTWVHGAAFDQIQQPMDVRPDTKTQQIKQAGFVEVEHTTREIPFHPWPKDQEL